VSARSLIQAQCLRHLAGFSGNLDHPQSFYFCLEWQQISLETEVIRLFNVYYPVRTVILVAGEALLVWSFVLLGTIWHVGELSYLTLNLEHGYYRIFLLTIIVILLSHWFDLYNPVEPFDKGELYFRLLMIPGLLALAIAMLQVKFPELIAGGFSFALALTMTAVALLSWRTIYSWLAQQPYLRERVYVLGSGARAQQLVRGLQSRPDLGIDVVGWTGALDGVLTRENITAHLCEVAENKAVHRVILAMQDRRDKMPVEALLNFRLQGAVQIEEATSWLEKMSGKIELEQLYPSWIIFAEGFRFSNAFRFIRRLLNFAVGLVGIILTAPLMPFIALAIRLDSRGPVLYRQQRVGRAGKVFYCYKFRTMRRDAEADVGPTWAGNDDPRITRIGKFLRMSRLDEIPQLWCVLRGDMAFVGPRPERPEFVEWLSREIPYYGVRHIVRPGITGWAQIRYRYGNSVEDAKEKLQYDLFYIKNASIGLDLLIMFQTIKTVLHLRGA
jgi:sugar transferase (PEP-CTERM system associated)